MIANRPSHPSLVSELAHPRGSYALQDKSLCFDDVCGNGSLYLSLLLFAYMLTPRKTTARKSLAPTRKRAPFAGEARDLRCRRTLEGTSPRSILCMSVSVIVSECERECVSECECECVCVAPMAKKIKSKTRRDDREKERGTERQRETDR